MKTSQEHIYTRAYFDIPILAKVGLLPFGFLLLLCLKILRPWVFIRIGLLAYERVGELSTMAEAYLRRQASYSQPSRERHIFISGKPANQQLLKMISRRIRVIQVNRYFLWVIRKVIRMCPSAKVWLPIKNLEYFGIEKFYPEFNQQPPQLSFAPQEEAEGKKLLSLMGIPPQANFVCLHVRDKAYLDYVHPSRNRDEWAYQDYRDCDINTYKLAIDYLVSQGLYVLRMGYIVEKKLDMDSPLVIDYARQYRSDFGDIYLSAKCKFFIGSEGGLICIPWMFNVPVAYANRIPVTIGGRNPSNVFLPKKLYCVAEKRFLGFREIYARKADEWFYSGNYQQGGVEIVNNTPEEILGLVREMNERIDGRWQANAEDERLQERFRAILPARIQRCAPLPRISAEFLRKNPDLLN